MPETSQAATPAQPLAAAPQGQMARSWFPTPRQLFIVLLGYFAFQVILRTWLSGSADLDESEQFLLAQKLNWGYGPEPPLYTWVQSAFFALFGQSIFSLSLLKNLLLGCTYLITYHSGRLITGRPAGGVAAAISLLLLPEVAWESQRDLTHSVLATTLAAGTLLCLARAHESKQTGWYCRLGLCAGLGLLSKYNYAFWVVGLLLAALSLRKFRPTVLTKRMLLALAICALIFLPNALWILGHRELAFLTAFKFDVQPAGGALRTVLTGIEKMLLAMCSFVGPLVLVWVAILVKASASPVAPRPERDYAKLILRALLVIVVMLVLLIVSFRATGFRERWFQPILICTPVLVVALAAHRLDPRRLRWLAAVGLLVMVAIAVVMPGRIVFAEALKREEPLNHPYAELAAQIRAVLPPSTFLVAETRVLGGNLRMRLPDTTVVTPELAVLFPTRAQHCFLVWDATPRPLPSDSLLDWAQPQASADLRHVTPAYFSATYKYHSVRQLRLGLLQVR